MATTSPEHADLTPDKNDSSPPLLLLPFALLGEKFLHVINNLGAISIFFAKSFAGIFTRDQFSATVQQVYYIGAKSVNIVILVALFVGMVIALQMYHVLVDYGSVGVLGSAVSLSLIREMGPVLTAIMITARAGSAMTAEIGIQRISEQIDALETMRINPLLYLVSPRIAAAIISFPLLTTFFDLVGIIGGYFTGVILMGVNGGAYTNGVISSVKMDDITGGLIKAVVFAVLVATICCYQGFFTHMRADGRGAKGVSLSTTSAVVASCVLILVSDYILSTFLL